MKQVYLEFKINLKMWWALITKDSDSVYVGPFRDLFFDFINGEE